MRCSMRAKLGDVTENLDYKRVPIAQKDRADLEKLYPYYGAQGIVDYSRKSIPVLPFLMPTRIIFQNSKLYYPKMIASKIWQ